MPGRDTCLGWPAAIGALALFACCGAAMAQGAPPPPAVSVTPVASRQVTETGEFLGRVTAINKVDIVARVAGFIEERNFTEGQKVKTGDLLFRLEQATYKAAVEQQRANLAKAKATAVNTALQLQRGKELVRNQNIPQSTLDQRAADDAAAQAEVMQAQALLDQAQINLDYTEIRSPIDGRIGLAVYTVGNLVSPSSGTLATIVSQDPIYVIFQASERDVLDYSRRIAESADKSPHVVIHVKLPNGSIYPHPGLSNFLDVQVDATTDTRGGAGATAEPGRRSDPRRHRRRHGGTGRAALGADRSAVRGPARSGRPLRAGRRRQRTRSSSGASRPASSRDADIVVTERPQGGRAGHRRGHPEGASRTGRGGDASCRGN